MQQRFKKSLILILIMAMCLSMLPRTVLASEVETAEVATSTVSTVPEVDESQLETNTKGENKPEESPDFEVEGDTDEQMETDSTDVKETLENDNSEVEYDEVVLKERTLSTAFNTSDIIYGDDIGITRGEWLHNLSVMFEMSVDADDMPDEYFSDLDSSYEYYEDIMLNIAYGVIDIEAGGEVAAEDYTTRDFAAQTLNYLLGFQPENDTYTFSDSSSCTAPASAQIAVNRNWIALSGDKFLPDQLITQVEVTTMVSDTQTILGLDIIDESYDNTYYFASDVVEVPDGTNVTVDNDNIVTIQNCPVTIDEGGKFAVYLNGIAVVYYANSVSVSDSSVVIAASEVADEDAFLAYDAQGVIAPDISLIEAVDGATITYIDNSTEEVYETAREAIQLYGSKVLQKTTIEIAREYDCGGGVKINFKVKLKNPKIEYNLMSSGTVASAKLISNVEISYGVKGNLSETFDMDKIYLMRWGVPGIGGFDIFIDIELSGALTGVQKGDLEFGFAYYGGTDFRTPFQYRTNSYTVTAEATGAVGLQTQFGITQLPALKAYVYAKAGAKANLKSVTYDDNLIPERCTEFKSFLYSSYGAKGSIKIKGIYSKSISIDITVIDENNSPIRIIKHYDDGIQVASCGRGTKIGYLTSGLSRYATSGWSSGQGFGYDNEGNPVTLFTYTLDDDNNATITGYVGSANALIIPSQIDGYTVVAIGSKVFSGNTKLTTVIIPDTVTSIGNAAFKDCTNLENVTLPDSDLTLECGAFQNCTSLMTVHLPKDVSTGKYCSENGAYPGPFSGCKALYSVTFADGFTEIKNGLLYNSGLKTITIPSTVTTIDYRAFGNCSNLVTIEWNNCITTIGTQAFYNCTSLEIVNLPDTVTMLGCGAFQNCTNISSIYLPKDISTGKYCCQSTAYPGPFMGCSSLTNVTFADGYTEIKDGLFNSSGLTSIKLPDTITTIDYRAFGNCADLKSITWGKGLTTINWQAFYNCISVEVLDFPDSLSTIECGAFQNCTDVISVYLPKDLQTGKYCGNSAYPGPFAGCSGLKDVKFANGYTKITDGMFYNCTGLESIEIPNTVTTIGWKAFMNCTNLKAIELSDNIVSLGTYVFYGCTSMITAKWNNIISKIPDSTFYNCSSLASFEFPAVITSMGSSVFYGCTALSSIQWNTELTTIESNAFYNCDALTDISIPESVTSIGASAFYNCDALENVKITDSVTVIGNQVFYNCDALTNIIIPNSVTSLGTNVFYDCDALIDVTLGTGLTSIPTSTFEHCDSLTSIVLPYRIASIGANAFKNDVAFTAITIPRATTSIDSSAFSYPAQITIYGVSGTYAESYANENDILFVDQTIPATQVILNKSILTINKGSSEILTMSVIPENFTDEVSWKSTDTSIATINDTGEVKAVGLGTATIKLIVGDVSANCKVTVVQPVTSITLNTTSLSLEALNTYQLTATANPVTAENRDINWSTSDATIATVDETGLVTALGKGSATITATAADGSGVTKTCTVTVTNSAVVVNSPEELESAHNYPNNFSDYWVYTWKGATYLNVTFDQRTEVEEDFDFLYVYDAEGNEVGKYTGTSLAGKTVKVTGNTVKIKLVSDDSGNAWGFKVTQVTSDIPAGNPFTDVSENMYYYDPVLWALENGITSGLDSTHFAPEEVCTRGQVVTFLWRAMGEPEPSGNQVGFSDVLSSAYYYKAVLWALENGITSGLDSTHFAPDETVTRGQFVTFLYRAEDKPGYSVPNPFEDLPANMYYYDAVLWAYENGITAGLDATHFDPEAFCTRGQVVTFLYRAMK